MGENECKVGPPECRLKFHDFDFQVADRAVACRAIKMESCLYLWLGDPRDERMDDLSFAIESRLDREPISTKIMGPIADEASTRLAKRLSRKLGIPVYVSFNLTADNMSLPGIERKVREAIEESSIAG